MSRPARGKAPVDWFGKPIPPSELQAFMKDKPSVRAYQVAGKERKGLGLAASFEDYLKAELGVPVGKWEEIREFLRGCVYARDREVHGRDELWLHPEDFERLRVGDCEDHALWAWVRFVRLKWDARFTAGRRAGGGHAWVTIYQGRQVSVCETTAKRSASFLMESADESAAAYIPIWTVDRDLSFHWHDPGGLGSSGIRFNSRP